MTPVTVLCGAPQATRLDALLDDLGAQPAWRPFDARAVEFVGQFSRRLLTHPRIREFPELAALGHWFRPARLRDFASRHRSDVADAYVVGRGLAFHLAPANVDTVSMYSWLLSLLSGNANLVRVSQRIGPQLEFVLGVLKALLDETVGVPIASRIVLLTYPHDTATTAAISARCQARVVWGGDATVAAIRAIPLRPTATEVVFPDRFSLAAIDAGRVRQVPDAELAGLARAFYNDAFWFAQQACSSPRVLYWIGNDADCTAARARFWETVTDEVSRRAPKDTPAMAMARLEATFTLAAADAVHPVQGWLGPRQPLRLTLEQGLRPLVKEAHCGNGLFLEDTLPTLEALAPSLTDREQTLAVFGFDRPAVEALLAALPARALDRIVPIGSALDFSVIWDGIDLITALTRRIVVHLA